MQFLKARWFHRAQNGRSLSEDEKERCWTALRQFEADPGHPSLNFERLGSDAKQNHCSIRASRELRIILAVEPSFESPERVMFANMGHHDEMYDWARRRRFQSDLDDGVRIGDILGLKVWCKRCGRPEACKSGRYFSIRTRNVGYRAGSKERRGFVEAPERGRQFSVCIARPHWPGDFLAKKCCLQPISAHSCRM